MEPSRALFPYQEWVDCAACGVRWLSLRRTPRHKRDKQVTRCAACMAAQAGATHFSILSGEREEAEKKRRAKGDE